MVERTDLGKALMIVGGSLALTLLAAFLLAVYGEGGSPTKAAGLFAAQCAMWLMFLVGYYLRFPLVRTSHKPAAEEIGLQFVGRVRQLMSEGVLHADQK